MTLPDWMNPPTPTRAPTRAPEPPRAYASTRTPERKRIPLHADPGTPKRVSDLRARMGLSLNKMSRLMGVENATYRKWETGERIPTAAATRLIDIMEQIETHAPALHARLIAEVMK